MAENSIPEKASFSNESIKSVLFSIIFTFQSNLVNIRRFLEQKLKFIFFPLAALTEVITTFLALWGLIKADNKNLGKTSDFVLSLLATSLVLTAVIGGLTLWLNPITVSSLFIGAIGLGVIYHTGQFFYHAYRWLSTPLVDKEKRAFFREKTLKYLQGSLVGLAIIAGIVITMLLPMAAPIVLAVGISVAVVLLIDRIYKICQYRSATHSTENREDNISNGVNTENNQSPNQNSANVSSKKTFHYYAAENSETKLTKNFDRDEKNLIQKINDKENLLTREIIASKRTLSEFISPQEIKREIKKNHLAELKEVVESIKKNGKSTCKMPKKHGPVFQSFFKEKGEVEQLHDNVQNFINYYKFQP